MPTIDDYELEILSAYETGELKSVATKDELARFKAAARATAIKDRRVNSVIKQPRSRPTKRRPTSAS